MKDGKEKISNEDKKAKSDENKDISDIKEKNKNQKLKPDEPESDIVEKLRNELESEERTREQFWSYTRCG